MDQVHVVRHKVLVEGQSVRQVAREMGFSRNTVRRYLARPAPERVEQAPRARPVWSQVEGRLHALLEESPQWTGGKQRLTATRLHEMLVAEGHAVGATLVKKAVAEWKRRRREQGSRRELDRGRVFVTSAKRRLAENVAAFDENDDELPKTIAQRTCTGGGYPLNVI